MCSCNMCSWEAGSSIGPDIIFWFKINLGLQCQEQTLIPRFQSGLWHHRLPNINEIKIKSRLWWEFGIVSVTALTKNKASIPSQTKGHLSLLLHQFDNHCNANDEKIWLPEHIDMLWDVICTSVNLAVFGSGSGSLPIVTLTELLSHYLIQCWLVVNYRNVSTMTLLFVRG